jgi:hypothetical protein
LATDNVLVQLLAEASVSSGAHSSRIESALTGTAPLVRQSSKQLPEDARAASRLRTGRGLLARLVASGNFSDTVLTFPKDPDSGEEKTCIEGLHHINPSFLVHSGTHEVWAAFRTLCLRCDSDSCGPGERTWHSDLSVARVPMSDFVESRDVGGWMNFGIVADPRYLLQPSPEVSRSDGGDADGGDDQHCYLCRHRTSSALKRRRQENAVPASGAPQVHSEVRREAKGSAQMTLRECNAKPTPDTDNAEGPEDPRLFKVGNKTYVLFSGTQMVPPASHGRASCREHGLVPFVAEVRFGAPGPVEFGAAVQLRLDDMQWAEKNWSPFRWEPVGRPHEEKLMMVYSIHPHKILEVDPDGGDARFLCSTPAAPVVQLFHKYGWDPRGAHGGAGVVSLKNPDGGSYFLSVFHHITDWRDGEECEYFNFPYKFASEPPFQILEVGRPIELQTKVNPMNGGKIQFVSSLAVFQGQLHVGYNAGDTESRILQIPLDELEKVHFAKENTYSAE